MTYDGLNRSDNTKIIDASSKHEAHVSHFGVLKTGPTIPILKGNFPGTTLNRDIWNKELVNTGTITVANGMGQLSCGTSGVTVSGDYIRCARATSIIAGSNGTNVGSITVRQATTTANVFAVIPIGVGQTVIGAFTIPSGKIALLKRIRVNITRANGAAGSATIALSSRPRGESWRDIRTFELATGDSTEFTAFSGDVVLPGTDIKFTIRQVSDNNTICDGAIEYILMDE